MKMAILYAESEFTPWKENVDLETVELIYACLPHQGSIDIIHMKIPNEEFGNQLASYDTVVNMCYGFKEYTQARVASWLDNYQVRHLSSTGFAQQRVADKKWVEKCCKLHGINVPQTIYAAADIEECTHIIKPRYGSCHRDIAIMEAEELRNYLPELNIEQFICQPYLIGREFSVAIIPSDNGLEQIALPPVEIVPVPQRDFFVAGSSFGETKRQFSYQISSKILREMMEIAVKIHELAGLRYMSRIDMKVCNEKVYVLDLNPMPNLHQTKSLLPAILDYHSISMKELFRRKLKMKSIKEGLSRYSVLGWNRK
jgi:D-alanine-D-alanine ligase